MAVQGPPRSAGRQEDRRCEGDGEPLLPGSVLLAAFHPTGFLLRLTVVVEGWSLRVHHDFDDFPIFVVHEARVDEIRAERVKTAFLMIMRLWRPTRRSGAVS